MLNLNIANVGEGLRKSDVIVQPADLNLDKTEEFRHPLHIAFDVEKIGRNIFVNSGIRTEVDFLCDRCGELFNKEMAESVRLIYTYDEHMANKEDDDVSIFSDHMLHNDLVVTLVQYLLV